MNPAGSRFAVTVASPINPSAGEYVRQFCIHTNDVDGPRALLKRQIIGIHHWVSDKHLGHYFGEMNWRYNLREMGEGERVDALVARSSERLRYRELIA